MSKTTRLLKIFEYLWLMVALLCLVLGIIALAKGEGFTFYFVITILLTIMGLLMHKVKKGGRKSTEAYYKRKQNSSQDN